MDVQNRPSVTDEHAWVANEGQWEQREFEQSSIQPAIEPTSDAVRLADVHKKQRENPLRGTLHVARQGWQCVRRVRLLMLIPTLLLITCIVLATTSVWWFFYATNTVSTYQVPAMQQVSRDVGGGGVVFPRQQFDISYPMSERVQKVLVKAGDLVKSNQPLIKLDAVQVNAQLQEASSDVQAARNYLYSVNNIASSVVVAQAQQSYQIAQNRYNALTAQNANFHNGTLFAPMAGIVTAVNIDPGEMSAPNAIMLTIMDQSVVIVRAQIPLDYLGVVHTGSSAFVIPSAMPDSNFAGTVSAVVPRADAQTDTFEARITIPNTQQKIVPGMGAFVRIQFKSSAYVIPKASTYDTDHGTNVFVTNAQQIYVRSVHIVGRSSTSVFVDSGLAVGDNLIVAASNQLHDGQRVTNIG